MTPVLWYVSYGSNLLAERFHTYLTGSDADCEFGAHPQAPSTSLPTQHRWLWIDHALYFAGVSRRWTGSSAFVSHQVDTANPAVAHGYLIDRAQFAHLVAVENVVSSVDLGSIETLNVGEWTQLSMDRRGETFRGKYDALLRLSDIDEVPAFTLTSSIVREHGTPSDRYLDVIRRGLVSSTVDVDVDAYLGAAIARSGSNRVSPSTHPSWSSAARRCSPTNEKR